jgi:prenyltransferase beta subunit
MLQVARLAPSELGESRDLVAAFFRDRINPDGGFQDRSQTSDLYYTVFGLDGLIALQEDLPIERTSGFLETFGDGETLDFVHLGCLARSWAALKRPRTPAFIDTMVSRIESHRSDDGGYATTRRSRQGSAYAAFIALGAYQDLGREVPDPDSIAASVRALRAADGSYGHLRGLPTGLTTITAAAVTVLRHLGETPDRDTGMWLLDRCHANGGFFASCAAPVPDLLSTATALHALSTLHVPIAGLREPCLDFVDSLWTNRGGFFGTWADDAVDCEYTYYALLALGHLSLQPS